MSMQPAGPGPIAGRRLTSLLARWAGAHRLTARQAETIRQEIVAEPAPGDFDWWWRLLDPAGGSAFRALGAFTGWEVGQHAYGPATFSPTAWLPERSGLPIWTPDDADFQPYLRLT